MHDHDPTSGGPPPPPPPDARPPRDPGAQVAIHAAYYSEPDPTRTARHRQRLERLDFTHAGRAYACRVGAEGKWEYEVTHAQPDADPAEGSAGGGGWYLWRSRWPDDTPEEVAAGIIYHDRLRRDMGARAQLYEGHQVGDARAYTDARGVTWQVYEWEAGDEQAERRGQRCLVFEAAHVTWRLWEYPRRWQELSAAQLEAIGWRTEGGGADESRP